MIKTFLLDIIFNGKIPFFKFFEKVILFLSIVPILGIFLFPEDFRNLGELSWHLLILILIIRPLGDVFPEFKIFRGFLPLRKNLGILCGSLGIAHSIGYFFNSKLALPSSFFRAEIWDFHQHFFWGMIGFLIMIILTITSSFIAMIHLKHWWKRLHRMVYLLFFVVAIHVILIKFGKTGNFFDPEVLSAFLSILVLSTLWILSMFKISFRFKK